jgi:hypothetical protein
VNNKVFKIDVYQPEISFSIRSYGLNWQAWACLWAQGFIALVALLGKLLAAT